MKMIFSVILLQTGSSPWESAVQQLQTAFTGTIARGSFPRVLGRYVREQRVLPLETAVHKMTLMSAEQLSLKDRGRVAQGYIADLVLFDPASVTDQSTIEHPQPPPKGIPDVMVSGVCSSDWGWRQNRRRFKSTGP